MTMRLMLEIGADGSAAVTGIERVGVEIDQLGTATDRTTRKTDDLGKATAKTTRTARQDIADLRRDVERTGESFGVLGKAGVAALSGIAGAISAGALVSSFVDVNTEAGRLRASLETVTGSVTAAEDAWKRMTAFAAETPYSLDQAVEGFIKLKALGLDPSERALRSYGNTASAMGKQLNDMIEAVADASVGEFERLKEFGIKAAAEGDQVALTFQGVTTTIGKSAEEIQEYLLSIGETQFAGAMLRQMDALGGAMSNLGDTWAGLMVALGDAGATDVAIGAIRGLTGVISEARETVEAFRWAYEYLTKGVNPDKAVSKIGAGDFGLEDLRQESERVYDAILAKHEEVARLIQGGFWSRGAAEQSSAELRELVQRLDDVKAELASVEAQQDATWKAATKGADAAIDRTKVMDDNFKRSKEMRVDYLRQEAEAMGVSADLAQALYYQETKLGEAMSTGQSHWVKDMSRTDKAMKEIVGSFQMGRDEIKATGVEVGTYAGEVEAFIAHVQKLGAAGADNVREIAVAYHGGVGTLQKYLEKGDAWLREASPRTAKYADEVVAYWAKISGTADAAEEQQKVATKAVTEAREQQVKASKLAEDQERALAGATQSLIDQYLPARAAAERYAEAQIVLAQAVAKGSVSQIEATEILDKMAAKQVDAAEVASDKADVFATVWENAVERIDDGFASLWEDLFTGSTNAMDAIRTGLKRWLAEVAHMLTTQRLTLAIGASVTGGSAAASASGQAASAGLGGAQSVGYLGKISGLLSSNSIGEGVASALGKTFGQIGSVGESGWFNQGLSNLSGTSNLTLGASTLGGGLAGGLVASQMFEGEYVGIGSTIGSAVGATAAPLIAAAVGAGPVGWAALAGGAFLGAISGGGLGSLFGGEQEAPKITLEVTGGDFRVASTNGQWSVVDGGNGATTNALNQLNDEMQALAADLGPGAEAALAAFQHTGQTLSAENFQQWVDDVSAGMVRAMASGVRDDAIAEAGSGVLAGIMTDALAQVGDDPQAMLAAVAGAKRLEAALIATTENVFNAVGESVFDTADMGLVSTRIYQLAHATMGASEGIEGAMMRVMAGVDAGATALKLVGDEMAGLSVQAVYDVGAALADAAGGYETLAAGMASYYNLFFTEEERRADQIEAAQRQTSRALEDLGLAMPTSAAGFRDLIESLDLTSVSGQETFATLTGLSEQFSLLYEELEQTGTEVVDLGDQFLGLRSSLRELADDLDPQSSTANRAQAESALADAGYTGAFESAAIAEFIRALAEVDNAGGEAAEGLLAVSDALRAALDEAVRISEERAGLDLRLLELTGTETEYLAEVRRRELEGLDASNRAIKERIYALEDEARIAEERAGLDLRLLELTGTQAEYVAAIRERELEGLDASNRAIQERIWALEDEAAMQRAATDLTIRLLELQGDSEAALALRRQQELDATQPGLHALLLRIYALEDEERALQALQDSANDAYATLERAVDAEREAIDASYQAQIDAIDAQREATQDAYDAQRDAMQDAHDAQMEAYQAQREAAQEALSEAQAALSSIQSAISAIEGQQDVSAMTYAQAQADLSRYAKTGVLPEQDQLDSTLKTLGSIDQSDYASEADYLAAQGTTYANLLKLEKGAELQVDWAEATVDRLDEQIEIAQEQYDAQMELMQAQYDAQMEQYDAQAEAASEWRDAEMARLDLILEDAKAQLDVLMGIDTTLLSVEDALAQFLAAVAQTPPPAPPPGIETTQAASVEQATEQTAEIVALRNEVVLLRQDLAAIATAQVVPLKSLDDRLTKWDLDGIPPTRGDADTDTEQTVVLLKAG